ncbi:3-oxoacyl-ACP reductase [Acinetobacter baumannii]
MTDQYQAFTQSPIGKFVVKNLGLPSPVVLERFESAQPVVKGAVLVGAAPSSVLSGAIAQVLSNIHTDSYVGNNVALQQEAAKVGLNLRPFNAGDKESKFKAVVFDASGIQNSEQLNELYKFFNPIARQVATSGRVIVIGTTPETAKTVKQAIAQRALEGFIKSVGKEFKKGITAQVVYVDEGAAANLESTLRFLLSPRSAYVSGQVIRVSKADVVDVDWAKPLAGKTALVTGASRGIGEAIAHVLARDGAHVICLDVPQQQADLDRVAADIGGSTLAIDITAADAGEKIKAAAAKQGGLDIIVHNAGITRDKTLANMKPELWDLVININLSAAERVNDYLLENDGLNANGRIVCVSSISGIAGNLGQTNYAASKAGVIGLVKFTAPILKNGITINAVAPGFIETQMTAAIPFAIREAGRRMNSMQQGGLPVDVAETIAWFASTASTGVNGNVVRVCGQSLLGGLSTFS